METITLQPIGLIRAPFSKPEDMPIQPAAAEGINGSVEIFPEFIEGLADLDGFSHIYLIYHFHLSRDYKLTVVPFLDHVQRGLFATRAPRRPNAIGLSIVRLLEIKENILKIENVDIINETPLLDIKPYVPEMDAPENCKIGWLTRFTSNIQKVKSDNRFTEK